MKNEIFYLPENVIYINNAGYKAREDVDTILKSCGLKQLMTIEYGLLSDKIYRLRLDYWRFLFSLCNIKNKWIVVQYPVFIYGGRILKRAVDRLIHNNHLILFIHDLEYLRFKNTKSKLQYEINLLNRASIIVSHNSFMTTRLQQDGVTVPIIELRLFDYILKNPVPKCSCKLGNRIVFAGNLAKSGFLKDIAIKDLNVQFVLYGSGFDKNLIKWGNIKYSGSFSPDEVPYKLKGSFGLIWDGNSTSTCEGQTGEYMLYNNPHKLSLYIVAGLPVIAWRKAAIAQFVKFHNIGIVVDSLEEISTEINKIDIEEYKLMLNNIESLQKKIASGFFAKSALRSIDKIITEYYKN